MSWLRTILSSYEDIKPELYRRYNEASRQSKEIRKSMPITPVNTYAEEVLQEAQINRASYEPYKELIQWLEMTIPTIQDIPADIRQAIEEDMTFWKKIIQMSAQEMNADELENEKSRDHLEWLLEKGDEKALLNFLTTQNIPFDRHDAPTGKRVITIEMDGNLWVLEKDDQGLHYWDNPEDWLNSAVERSEEFYLPEDFSKTFWESPIPLYHATSDENVENISKRGLLARSFTRGIGNRNTGAAVFTISGENYDDIHSALLKLNSYGESVFEIDTAAMKQDGYMPDVAKEDPISEGELKISLANLIDYEYYGGDDYNSGEYFPDTVIIFGNIPAKYLNLL